jgi:hypothetical protein
MIPWYWATICMTLGLSAGILAGIWLAWPDEPPPEPLHEEPVFFPDYAKLYRDCRDQN